GPGAARRAGSLRRSWRRSLLVLHGDFLRADGVRRGAPGVGPEVVLGEEEVVRQREARLEGAVLHGDLGARDHLVVRRLVVLDDRLLDAGLAEVDRLELAADR